MNYYCCCFANVAAACANTLACKSVRVSECRARGKKGVSIDPRKMMMSAIDFEKQREEKKRTKKQHPLQAFIK
jgi:hypothetical protein